MRRTLAIAGIGLLMGWIAGSALGEDTLLPAEIRVRVTDENGTAVAGAHVSRDAQPGFGIGEMADALTDREGIVRLRYVTKATAPGAILLKVEKAGLEKGERMVTAFPGAEIEQTMMLRPVVRTTVHVRGPKGEAATGIKLRVIQSAEVRSANFISLSDLSFENPIDVTDARGDFVWEHVPWREGFAVMVGGQTQHFEEGKEAVVTLSAEEYGRLFPRRVLEGKLVLPDGTPAKQWLVAGHVDAEFSSVSIWMGALMARGVTLVGRQLEHVRADGTFTVTTPGDRFAVVSPEGVPLVYSLDPGSWQGVEGDKVVHHVTIAVPPVEKVIQETIVQANGEPLASVPVYAATMHSGQYSWGLRTEGPAEGAALLKIMTNAEGVFSMPVYMCTNVYMYQVGGNLPTKVWGATTNADERWEIRPQVGAGSRIVATKMVATDPPVRVLKDIAIEFIDEAGKQLNNVKIKHIKVEGENAELPQSTAVDVHGEHYFVSAGAKQMSIETAPGVWSRTVRTLDLGAGGRVMVVMKGEERNKPFRGRVVDADDKGVEGVAVFPYVKGPMVPGGGEQSEAMGEILTTDAQGRFAYEGLTDECLVGVFRARNGRSPTIPDMDAVKVTAEKREIEIRLPAYGSLRVIFPEMYPRPTHTLRLMTEGKDRGPLLMENTGEGLMAEAVDVGKYWFLPADVAALEDMKGVTFEVKAKKETVVDLRGHALAAWAQVKREKCAVRVERDGKPVEGAEVAVFREALPREALTEYLKAWSTAQAGAPDGMESLKKAGSIASELADTLAMPADRKSQLRALAVNYGDGLETEVMDVTDGNGVARFTGNAGHVYVAAARIRGQWVGLTEFTVKGGMENTVVVELVKGPLPVNKENDLKEKARVRLMGNDALWGGFEKQEWGIWTLE